MSDRRLKTQSFLRDMVLDLYVQGRKHIEAVDELYVRALSLGVSLAELEQITETVYGSRTVRQTTEKSEEQSPHSCGDVLQAAEDLGRKIAAALEPLGLSPSAVQAAAAYAADKGRVLEPALQSRISLRREMMRGSAQGTVECYARAAGAAAYFESKSD